MEEKYVNSIGMEMRLIPAGEFIMGEDDWVESRPAHKVKITKPFYIGTYPVTQRQWIEIMGHNHSCFTGFEDSLDRPVDRIGYKRAEQFIEILNRKEGKEYRLPTEAEWEYACRAGSKTSYYFGDDPDLLPGYAWYFDNTLREDGKRESKPVGLKKPNAFYLHDMLGNICELCSDYYGPFPEEDLRIDPKGPDGGDMRVMKGGCWNYPGGKRFHSGSKKLVTSFWRGEVGLGQEDRGHGFRLVVGAETFN